jgi:O-antigen ligase
VFKHVGRLATGACGLCLAVLLAALLGAEERAVVGTVLAVIVAGAAAVRPHIALLATLGLMPLGAALPLATHLPLPWTDILIAAGAAGWLLRTAVTAERFGQPSFARLALALGVTATASGLATFGGEHIATIPPPMGLPDWWRATVDALRGVEPMRGSLRLASGLAAAVWAAETMRDETRRLAAARLAAIGAAGLAAISLYRLAEIGLRSPAPFDRMLDVVLTVRFAPVIGDPNAQTALFLLVLPTAFAMGRAGPHRLVGAIVTVVILLGAWLAGSRTALALVPVALGALLLLQRRTSGLSRRVLAAVLVAVTVTLAVLAWTGRHGAGAAAWSIRRDFATVTTRMVVDEPVFGVGIGRFYDESSKYMPESLRRFYARENAHNQFFQFAGELGVAGLVLFVILVASALWPALHRGPIAAAPLVVGLLAFLASAMAQHPLLDPQVAGTFWLLLGTLKAWTPDGAPGRVVARVAVTWTVLIALLVPVQAARRAEDVDLSLRVVGARRPSVGGTAAPYFTAASRATIYLPADAQNCRLRLRARGLHGEADVTLHLDHRPAGSLTLARGEWRETAIRLPGPAARSSGLRHRRLDLRWTSPRQARSVIDFMTPDCR